MRSKYLFLFIILFSPMAALAILPIQHWQTSSGARVYFVQNRDIPMLDLSRSKSVAKPSSSRDAVDMVIAVLYPDHHHLQTQASHQINHKGNRLVELLDLSDQILSKTAIVKI